MLGVNEVSSESKRYSGHYYSDSQDTSVNREKQIVKSKQQGEGKKENEKVSNRQGASLSISPDGLGLLQNKREETSGALDSETTDTKIAEKQMYQEQLEASKEEGDGFVDLAKIMEIARRISRGDEVPSDDEKRLMEYNFKLYQAAKTAAMLHANEKHKRHKSLFEEENDTDSMLRELERENEGILQDSAETTQGATVSETAGDMTEAN